MWENIENETQGLTWLAAGLRDGTVVAVTDGSYDQKAAPHVSGSG